jgi:3',5'-cyclic AMP phosphodiesterase CpdA
VSATFTFAVIADSHFQLPGATEQSAYDSDAHHNARNKYVVSTINGSAAAFTIHGGDVPHPVPGLVAHLIALDIAAETYGELKHPLYVVPGNHDVGDKPNAWKVASSADDAKHAVFEQYWGPSWQAFSHEDCCFILLDTPIVNGGSDRERAQQIWLTNTLRDAKLKNQRIFVFLHYPPFLTDPQEPEHYDNIALPGRLLLLDELAEANVEAIFCGHVHHFFYNRYKDIPIYILPATSFVRPEYSELAPVQPGDEFGRNDVEKLGFFFVHINPTGHTLEPVRTHGGEDQPSLDMHHGIRPPPPNPLGVSISNDLTHLYDIPCGNLDAFRRKSARNDLAIQAMLELGIRLIRIPGGDLCSPRRLTRLREIAALGFRFAPFSGGAEILTHLDAIAKNHDVIAHWELVTSDGSVHPTVAAAHNLPPLIVSVIGERRSEQGSPNSTERYFSHFPPIGFEPGEKGVQENLLRCPPNTGFLSRCAHDANIWEAAVATQEQACTLNVMAAMLVELPKDGEGTCLTDDDLIAARVATAFLAAIAFPKLTITIDPFIDHDRGYYPKHGILDRGRNPRLALHILRNLNRAIPTGCGITPNHDGTFHTDVGVVSLNIHGKFHVRSKENETNLRSR